MHLPYDRLAAFSDFMLYDRMLWIYPRKAVGRALELEDLPDLKAAHDGVKAFTRYLPSEQAQRTASREAGMVRGFHPLWERKNGRQRWGGWRPSLEVTMDQIATVSSARPSLPRHS